MKNILFYAFISLITLTLVVSSAFAQSISELNGEIQGFEKRISELEKVYLKPAFIAAKYKLEARFNDASVAYELKDYERASFLFIDVVSSERFKKYPSYRRAHFLLGDSLFQMRNYIGAKFYLERLINLGQGEYSTEAGALLLEVAYRTGNYGSIDKIFAKMKSQKLSPAVQYLAGKAFYEKKSFVRARNNFKLAIKDKRYKKLGKYFMGVTYAAEKKFDLAKKQFENVLESEPDNDRDMEVNNLAYIALGRIAYEVGDIEYAIDFYNRVGRGSRHFDRALWELTWVLVAKKEFQSARTNVDILLNFQNTGASLLAEARLLRGDLSLRMKEYEQASQDYKMVVQKFSPVMEQMNIFIAKHKNVDAFFAAIIHEDFNGIESVSLPPLVEEWMHSDPKMQKSMQTLHDIKKIESDIAYAFLLLDEMDVRLSSKNKIMSVPILAEGLIQGLDSENRLIVIRRALIDREAKLVGRNIPTTETAKWKVLEAEIDALGKVFKQIPQTREDIAKRDNQRFKAFTKLRRNLDDIAFKIQNKNEQINAVNNYIREKYGRPLSEGEKEELTTYRKKLVVNVKQETERKQKLENELGRMKSELGVGDSATQAEAILRNKYRNKLQEAQSFLSQFGSSEALKNLQAAQLRIPAYEQRLDAYYKKLEIFAGKALVEIQREVKKQRELGSSYRESVRSLMSSSKGGAGILAYINFMAARQQFNQTVLKGDVGLIDVAWQQKDEQSSKISQMFEDRAAELKLLQESFDEVR